MKHDTGQALRFNPNATRSTTQVVFLVLFLIVFFILIASTKVLLIPIMLSITLYFMLNPLVNILERKGYSRTTGAIIASFAFYTPAVVIVYFTVASVYKDLASFETEIPKYIGLAQDRLHQMEESMVERFHFIEDLNVSTWGVNFFREQSSHFLSQSPEILNTILWAAILLPILTFFFLRDAITIRNILLNLTPNRYFEQAFSVSHQIEKKIGTFIITKIAEAFLVGLITLISLTLLHFPYSFLFSVIAGLTNIIPYFGPVIGYLPIVAIPIFVPAYEHLLYPALIVSAGVNALDMIVIFPLLVSRVIDLHPLVVLLSVIIGGNIAGPIGLLVAIPAAAIVKIFAYEVLSISPKIFRA